MVFDLVGREFVGDVSVVGDGLELQLHQAASRLQSVRCVLGEVVERSQGLGPFQGSG